MLEDIDDPEGHPVPTGLIDKLNSKDRITTKMEQRVMHANALRRNF